MSYRRTRELATTQKTSPKAKPVAPEDDWNLVANPSVYLDELPQPFRFINNALVESVLKPVMNKITEIEQRKQTSEYEGFLKEGTATGQIEIDQATCIHRVGQSLGPGGIINKEEQAGMLSKVVTGDNFGTLVLIDVARKLVQDRFKVPAFEGRRIISISSCTVEWAGTQLTYVAACARGVAQVQVMVFKHQDCKLKHLYSLNLIPDLANPETPELNAD